MRWYKLMLKPMAVLGLGALLIAELAVFILGLGVTVCDRAVCLARCNSEAIFEALAYISVALALLFFGFVLGVIVCGLLI